MRAVTIFMSYCIAVMLWFMYANYNGYSLIHAFGKKGPRIFSSYNHK